MAGGKRIDAVIGSGWVRAPLGRDGGPAASMPKRKMKPEAIHPFDLVHGTDTSGLLPGPVIAKGTGFAPEQLTAYYGVAPSLLENALDLWREECAPLAPIEQTVFWDVGAGKGRAMLVASQYPFLRVEGIELNDALAAIAQANLEIWRHSGRAGAHAPLQLHQGDATRYPLPAEPTLAFLFHPFEERLLRRFLQHVQASLRERPRSFDVIYMNAEHGALVERGPGVQRLWQGEIAMSATDHLADLASIEEQEEYGSTGTELCSIYRTAVKR